MRDKLILSSFLLVFVIGGWLGAKFPEINYRTSSYHLRNKKPSKAEIKRFKISSYIMMGFGIFLIIMVFLGGFKGV